METTITYSDLVKGWPSRYSFNPDFMLGCNSHFYTFKEGNLFRHNTNERRNNFYGEDYPSIITTVFNQDILSNKVYKTISLQGDSGWSAELSTDIQEGSFIESDWFEKKEEVWFGFIRNPNEVPAVLDEFVSRSATGIGRSIAVSGIATAKKIDFQISPTIVSIGNIVSVGDYLYFAVPPFTNPQYCGRITNIVQNYVNNDNYLIVDTTGGTQPTNQTDYFVALKNGTAESMGILGHLCIITLESDSTEKVELFSVETEIMKSFP